MCQNIKMLANSRQMSLNCVFFFCTIQSEPSLSHPRLVSYWQSWKSLAAALPDGGSALWSRRACSAFPLQYLIPESDTCSRLATERVRSSGEWLMPRPFVVGVFLLTRSSKLSQTLWRTTLLPPAFWLWSDNYSLFHAARSLFLCILHENWVRLNW